jgi:hypothetical protein
MNQVIKYESGVLVGGVFYGRAGHATEAQADLAAALAYGNGRITAVRKIGASLSRLPSHRAFLATIRKAA